MFRDHFIYINLLIWTPPHSRPLYPINELSFKKNLLVPLVLSKQNQLLFYKYFIFVVFVMNYNGKHSDLSSQTNARDIIIVCNGCKTKMQKKSHYAGTHFFVLHSDIKFAIIRIINGIRLDCVIFAKPAIWIN